MMFAVLVIFIDPVVIVLGAIAGWQARRWWHFALAATAIGVLMELVWSGGMPTGFVMLRCLSAMLWAGLAFLITNRRGRARSQTG
jgi:hypothetical protein